MTPWEQDLWIELVQEAEGTTEIECVPRRIISLQGMRFQAPDFSTDAERFVFYLRLACHYRIEQLEPRGLPEAYQSLGEFVKYYAPTEEDEQDFQALDATTDKKSAVIRRILPSVEEPPFRISED